jgi:hypothetical protein
MQIEFQQPPEKLPTQMKLSKHGPPHTPPSYLYKQILPAKRSMASYRVPPRNQSASSRRGEISRYAV